MKKSGSWIRDELPGPATLATTTHNQYFMVISDLVLLDPDPGPNAIISTKIY
jgi:hypothetical protein